MTSAPAVHVEAALGSVPSGGPWMTLDDPSRGVLDAAFLAEDVLGTGFWTDLATEGVYNVKTKRGRQRLLQSSEAGTFEATVANPTRRMDPYNLAGPYLDAVGATLLKPMRAVRLRADGWGYSYVTVGATVNDYVSTPDSAALSPPVLYFEWIGSAPWTTAGIATIVGKWGAAGQRSWRLRINAGFLEFQWSNDGTVTNTIGSLIGTVNTDDTNIAGIVFYFDPDGTNTDFSDIYIPGNAVLGIAVYTQEGASGTFDGFLGQAATTIKDSTAPLTIGQANAANKSPGNVYYFAQFDRGYDPDTIRLSPYDAPSSPFPAAAKDYRRGRAVVYFDATWITPSATTVRSYSTDEVWTLNGAAAAGGDSADYGLWRGYADDWKPSWDDPGDAQTTLPATDGFKVLARVDKNGAAPVGGNELSGARIGRLLDAGSWPAGDRDIDAGQTRVQATTLAQNVLTELYLTTDTERGEFYISADGKATFRDRMARYWRMRSRQRQWLFGDASDGIEIPYIDIVPGTDDDLVLNDISVARVGGTAQTAADAVSIATFLDRTFTRDDLIHQTDVESRDYAGVTLAEFKDQDTRFDSITVEASQDDRIWPVILQAQIGDRATVRRRPPGGGAMIERDCFIEGIEHDLRPPTLWRATFQLSDASRFLGFILNDASLGVLDLNRLHL